MANLDAGLSEICVPNTLLAGVGGFLVATPTSPTLNCWSAPDGCTPLSLPPLRVCDAASVGGLNAPAPILDQGHKLLRVHLEVLLGIRVRGARLTIARGGMSSTNWRRGEACLFPWSRPIRVYRPTNQLHDFLFPLVGEGDKTSALAIHPYILERPSLSTVVAHQVRPQDYQGFHVLNDLNLRKRKGNIVGELHVYRAWHNTMSGCS